MRISLLFLLLIYLLQIDRSNASHIIGYDMNLINIKNAQGQPTDNYKFRLKFYRDVTGILIPSSFTFTIKQNGSNIQVATVTLNKINPQTFINVPPGDCPPIGYSSGKVELGIYESPSINMANYNNTSGYYIYSEQNARNPGIKNVLGPSDYYAILMTMEFPALSTNASTRYNSSPIMNKLPLTYYCNQQEINVALNVIDPDGDSLVFSIVQPLDGGTQKPFDVIPFATGYGLNSNIFDGSPDVSINSSNGNLFFKPTQFGKYLVAVKCDEYRNGIKIGEIRRELQVEVVMCQEAKPEIKDLTNNVFDISRDTIAVNGTTNYSSTYKISDVFNDSLFLKVIPDTGANNNIFDSNQFNVNWLRNDSLNLPFNIFGLSMKGKGIYNLDFKWNIDSTDIKKTPYKFRLIVFDKACPLPLSDTLDVELLVTGQCYQNESSNLIACDSLVDFKGRIFYADATTLDTITSQIGCDKILTQNIKINKSPNITYLLNQSCDSILGMDGKMYYSDTLLIKSYTSANKCDSVVYQAIYIKESVSLPIRGLNQITDLSVNYFYAVDSIPGLYYEWNIDNGQIISGGNSNLVEVKWNGSGQLKCFTYFDTLCVKSSIYNVSTSVGLNNSPLSNLSVYPNPATNKILIQSLDNSDFYQIQIIDLKGKILKDLKLIENSEIDIQDLPKGIFILKVNDTYYRIAKI